MPRISLTSLNDPAPWTHAQAAAQTLIDQGSGVVLGGSGSAIAVVAAIVFGVNVVHDAMYGPQAAWIAELFDTRVRYSGSSLGYQIGAVLSGGFAPLIAAALLAVGGGRPWLIVAYFAVLAAITVAAAYGARETRADQLR